MSRPARAATAAAVDGATDRSVSVRSAHRGSSRAPRTATTTPPRPAGRSAVGVGSGRGSAAGDGTGSGIDRARTAPAAPLRTGPVSGRPQLRLVPAPPSPSRARRTDSAGRRAPFVLVVVLMLVGTTVSLLLLNTAIAVDSLEATQRRAAIADQAQQVDRLEQQVLSGSTATELARAAAANGLVPSGAAAHLVLGPDGTSVVRGTAEPAPAAAAPSAAPPAAAVPPGTEPALPAADPAVPATPATPPGD